MGTRTKSSPFRWWAVPAEAGLLNNAVKLQHLPQWPTPRATRGPRNAVKLPYLQWPTPRPTRGPRNAVKPPRLFQRRGLLQRGHPMPVAIRRPCPCRWRTPRVTGGPLNALKLFQLPGVVLASGGLLHAVLGKGLKRSTCRSLLCSGSPPAVAGSCCAED